MPKNLFNQCNLRNSWLTNDLRACKMLYICRETFTDVMSALQIGPFCTNKPNFRKSQMNVNRVLTRDYEELDTWSIGKNKPNSNPIQSQFKANQTQNKPNTKPNKPNFRDKKCCCVKRLRIPKMPAWKKFDKLLEICLNVGWRTLIALVEYQLSGTLFFHNCRAIQQKRKDFVSTGKKRT